MEKIKRLAEILVNYSIKINKGDSIVISGGIESQDLAKECYKLVLKKGAYPRINISLPGLAYYYYQNATEEQLNHFPSLSEHIAKNTQGVISLWSTTNTKEMSNVDSKKLALRRKVTKPISDIRIAQDNWVGCGYPTSAVAQDAEMSLEEFENFFFDAVLIDWKAHSKEQNKIKELLEKTDKVQIIGKETDLTFSIKGLGGVKCDGHHNMPDGEVYSAPIKDSVNGKIYYEFPAIYAGKEVRGVRLEFENGKVIKATAEKNEDLLLEMINSDDGAKYLGEFGIGTNKGIKRHIKQILFDEKIYGTIHLALGKCYPDCNNGNESALHWDMIKDLRKEGKVMFDNTVVFEDGHWLL
jgi:aminopeptidase